MYYLRWMKGGQVVRRITFYLNKKCNVFSLIKQMIKLVDKENPSQYNKEGICVQYAAPGCTKGIEYLHPLGATQLYSS